MEGHHQAVVHGQKIRQHAVVELGGEDLQEGNGAMLSAHPKVPALRKIKG